MKAKIKAENIEILLRLYCFEEEIKGKIKNYEKYKKENKVGIPINKEFIEEYKKHLEYKNFINKLIDYKKNKDILNCLKDENGIINHDKLDKNNNLLTIIQTLKKTNTQLVEKINNTDLKSINFKNGIKIKYKKLEKLELL